MLGLARVNRGGRAALFARFEEAYGFDLETVFEQQGLSLWKREGAYLALPEVFLNQFSDFPCHWVGFAIGEDTRDGFIPSHELVARFGSRFGRGKTIISLAQAGTWLRGSDVEFEAVKDGPVPAQSTSGPGPLVRVVEDEAGRLLGRGKILHDRTGGGYRIKNLLPRRLAVGM
jgi:NOL1/NOP2/fmu family ribosome biogenesis protein